MNTEELTEVVRQALSDSEVLHCTRDWSGWFYDTMSDDDFVDASDGPLPEEIVEAILPMIRKRMAKAWDEGASEGAKAVNLIWSMDLSTAPRIINPYVEE